MIRMLLIRETGNDGKGGKFVFRICRPIQLLCPKFPQMEVTFAGNLLVGKNSTKPLTNTKVNLLNAKGEVVQTVYNTLSVHFVLTNLPAIKISW